MKAICVHHFGGPEALQLSEVAPPVPSSGQVLVAVQAAGVNPVDTYIRAGLYPLKPDLPYTPGMDGAGSIEAVGDNADGFNTGDRVYISRSLSGTYAEKALCRVDQVHPLPESISFAQGAALGVPYGTAYQALYHKAGARPGQSLLIHGATGGVGTAAVQMALSLGMTVFATAGTEQGRALLAEMGVHYILDHHDPDRAGQIMDKTSGHGIDIILEMLANENLDTDLHMLAQGGIVVVIGSRDTVEIDPRLLMTRDTTVTGMLLMSASPQERTAIHAGIYAGLQHEILCPVIAHQYPLAQAAQAHRDVMESPHSGKLVLTIEQ